MIINKKIYKNTNAVLENVYVREFDLSDNDLDEMTSVHFIDSDISCFKGKITVPELSFLSSTVSCDLESHFHGVEKLSIENSFVNFENIHNLRDIFLSEMELEFSERTFESVENLTLKKCTIGSFANIKKLCNLRVLTLFLNDYKNDRLAIKKIVHELEEKGIVVNARYQ